VKVLNPVIAHITLDQGFHLPEVSTVISEMSKRECLQIFRPTQKERETG